jgi:stage II sporulation protein D
MKIYRIIFLPILLLLSCAVPPSFKPPTEALIIRVGLVDGVDEIEFAPAGAFRIYTHDAGTASFPFHEGLWRLSVPSKAPGPQTDGVSPSSGPTVPRQNDNRPATAGDVTLSPPAGEQQVFKCPIRLSGCSITLKNVPAGAGYHWAHQEDRSYDGEIEVQYDPESGLRVINVLPLETYLEGVLPGEMSPHFPLEALKAQAIAARTFFLYNFGKIHRQDPYDVCDEVHCQVYVGKNNRSPEVIEAIKSTHGQVLTCNGDLCLTPYSAVCGGHTENAENVWDGDGRPYLQGVYDHPDAEKLARVFDLSKEENVKRWIESKPKVYCNIESAGTPSFAAYSQNYFRWEKRMSRSEIEKNLMAKMHVSVGRLEDIVPVRRGVSGRLIEVRVCGTQDTITVTKELKIRTAFSTDALYSACFIVEKNASADSTDPEYLFKGAGWGHGVGMCQIGAAMLAVQGMSCKDILAHYYKGTQVTGIY